ncbi:uncharacterized protein LOC130647286 [Hydractinia symbiolongicarpus]|uniref:uncharacterized protein LOC130647286 n=1 Tax=Hydractinia symbiolongicarpus TaxID=13093 RepID=UPI00254CAED6|nr:uncharacterized protein LOC130647286 [Hydractinia symbiolongicarpus]
MCWICSGDDGNANICVHYRHEQSGIKTNEAELRDFVDFMEQETTLENDPLYSREAISELKNKKDNDVKNKKDPPKLKTNLTGVTRDCLYCSNKHKLEDCRKIMKIDVEGNVNCCLLLGKSRVAPIKMVSIPRLELTAATVAVKVGVMLKQEMPAVDYECYWTDSNVVLGYINNESRRFHIFVANRIQQIQENTSLD